MAGLGSSWGSREEFLHPRDKRGRFRKKWKMADNVINSISSFLDRFSPRTFQSDGQAAQYLFNRAKPGRFGGGTQYSRLHGDYDEANEHLRAGDIDAPTQKFVKMMDDSAVNLDSEVILSRTMGPEAFGLTPQTLGLEDGGLEDFTGRLIADRGYSAANIGTPLSHEPGKITMSIAVPKGTKAIIPARSQNDRGIFLDRDQELRITKVEPDGRGGYYMLAVATPRTPGQTPEPIDRGPRGVGLTPQEREARILRGQSMQAKREGIRSDAEINAEEVQRGTQQGLQDQPTELPPAQGAPPTPGEPPPRNEPVVTEALGGPDLQGKGTAEIAETPPPEAPAAPEVPAAPAPDIRRAVREAGVPSPSAGNRRREWNNAYLGVASGKKDPGDMLRELERDIDVNRHRLQDQRDRGDTTSDPTLEDDIKAQEQLADLISREYGVQRQQAPAPAPTKKAAPSGVTPIAQAPGERRRELPGEPGTREVTTIKKFQAKKAAGIQEREERKRRLLAPEPEVAAPRPAPKKAAPAKVIPIERAKLTPEQRRQVSDLSDEERRSYQGFRGRGQSHEDALQSAQDAVATRNVQKAEQANKALAKKATPPVKKAPDVVRGKTRATALEPGDRIMVETDSEGNILPEMVRGDGRPATVDKVNPDGSLDITEADGTKVTTKGQEAAPGAQMPYYRKETATEARRAAKKAAPTAPAAKKVAPAAAPEAGAPDIDKMTVPELKALAQREGVSLRGLTRKQQIKDAITTRRTTVGQEGGPSVPEAVAAPQAPAAGFPETTPGSGKVRMSQLRPGVPILVEQREDGTWVPATKKTGATRITVQEVNPVTGRGGQRQVVGTDENGNRIEVQSRANVQTFFLGSVPAKKAAAKKTAPVPAPIVNNPVAQKPIQAPDRKEAFAEDWLNTPAVANIGENTAAGRSINEVRDDVLKGQLTPDEGIRRLEVDIEINKSDLAEVERELRRGADLDPEERDQLRNDREKLRAAIRDQENASSFMRKHFRKAPEITPQEIEVQLDPETAKQIREATPEEIKAAGRLGGFKDLKGEAKEELLRDLIKKIRSQELESRAAKKAAPKKLAPAPLEPKKAAAPGRVDARLIAEGLDMDESDSRMLQGIQEDLDSGKKSPAAVGRKLADLVKGPGGPAYRAAILEAGGDLTPANQAELDRLRAQADRWRALADRLQKTRRPSAKKAAAPAPSTKLTPEEKKTTKAAAELLDVPAEQLQAQVVAKRTAAKPPSPGAQQSVDAMKAMQSREEGQAFLKNRTKAELTDIAKAGGISYGSKDTKAKISDAIVQWTIGRRLDSEAISRPRGERTQGTAPEPSLEDMSPAELADLEAELGIKRTSLDRGDRIAAIRAKQAGQAPERKPGPKPEGSPVRHRLVPDEGGRLGTHDRPNADDPIHLPNGGMDQGMVHMDSSLGGLWQDLYMDDREPNSFVNEIARIGERVGTGEISLNQALDMLKALKGRASDKAIEERIQNTINDLDAPEVSLPDLPDTVPEVVKDALRRLAEIPTARRTGRIGASRTEESVLNKKLDIVRKIDAGWPGRLGEADSALGNRDLHENADGALQMWRLFESLRGNQDVRRWIRDAAMRAEGR